MLRLLRHCNRFNASLQHSRLLRNFRSRSWWTPVDMLLGAWNFAQSRLKSEMYADGIRLLLMWLACFTNASEVVCVWYWSHFCFRNLWRECEQWWLAVVNMQLMMTWRWFVMLKNIFVYDHLYNTFKTTTSLITIINIIIITITITLQWAYRSTSCINNPNQSSYHHHNIHIFTNRLPV